MIPVRGAYGSTCGADANPLSPSARDRYAVATGPVSTRWITPAASTSMRASLRDELAHPEAGRHENQDERGDLEEPAQVDALAEHEVRDARA